MNNKWVYQIVHNADEQLEGESYVTNTLVEEVDDSETSSYTKCLDSCRSIWTAKQYIRTSESRRTEEDLPIEEITSSRAGYGTSNWTRNSTNTTGKSIGIQSSSPA